MLSKKCEYCEKVIEGYKETQVQYLMKQHKMIKHQDDWFKELEKSQKVKK